MSNLLDDCKQFADRHRRRYVTTGPHWSTIIRFTKLYDYASGLETALQDIIFECGLHGMGNVDGLKITGIAQKALKGGEE